MNDRGAQDDGPGSEVVGIVLVDHGSRRDESNRQLLVLAADWERSGPFTIVEPAHMELAEPSIAQAFDKCVERGAKLVVVSPFFLLPGRHWQSDIPSLASDAASRHPGIRHLVASPLGLHPLMTGILSDRVRQCMEHADGQRDACEFCEGSGACQWRD